MQPITFATEFVWSEFSAQLRRFIVQQVHDETAADYILQETFVKIHLNVHTLQHADKLQSWLYQITRNAIADYYRRDKSAGAAAEPISDNATEWETDPSEADCDARGCVTAVLLGMPDEYRIPLVLDTQGLPQKQIADQLGLSHSAAKSRVQRGRAMLRQTLLDICKFEFDRRGNILACEV